VSPGASRALTAALVAAVALAALAAGVLVQWQRTGLDSASSTAVLALTRAEFPDLGGKITTIGQWKGKIVVVNFWATWCPPCRREIPDLVRVQRALGANGVQIVGIAVDEPGKVAAYAAEIGMTYPTLIGGFEAIELSRGLGNKSGALPFTLVLDRSGRLVQTHLGAMTEDQLKAVLEPLLGS